MITTFVNQALTGIAKILIGSGAWENVKDAVIKASKLDITGDEKFAVVYSALKISAHDVVKPLLKLAIEIAAVVLTDVVKNAIAKKMSNSTPVV